MPDPEERSMGISFCTFGPGFHRLCCMKQLALVGILLLSALTVSCRKQDIRTVTVRVPEMKNKACAQIIHNVLCKVHGVQGDKIQIDLTSRTVTVTYDSLKLALKNIEFDIAGAGFRANEIPAKPEAVKALPPECK